jgi:hypothetical protein
VQFSTLNFSPEKRVSRNTLLTAAAKRLQLAGKFGVTPNSTTSFPTRPIRNSETYPDGLTPFAVETKLKFAFSAIKQHSNIRNLLQIFESNKLPATKLWSHHQAFS